MDRAFRGRNTRYPPSPPCFFLSLSLTSPSPLPFLTSLLLLLLTLPSIPPGTIGITTYAASALGDVVFIELPEIGQEVSAGDTIGAVESVKSASDILTPLSGTVIAANEALEGKPSIINKAPEGEGWIAMIEVKSGGEDGSGSGGKEGDKEKLMDEEEYRRFTEEV